MKLLVDACLSPRILPRIAGLFVDCTHVFECGGIADDDRLIWEFAKAGGYAILSKDRDFMHMSDVFGAPPKVVWVRVGNAGTEPSPGLVSRKIGEFYRFEADGQAAMRIVDM